MSDHDTRLVDTYGRGHRDMRVSLTDRCSLRCTYCMPADFADWIPSAELLTTDELMTVLEVSIEEGIDEVRLTGGEPLLRPDAVDVVRRINALPRPPRVSLTTNGLRLAAQAGALRDAGLERVNISLDTLDRERFKKMTHRDRLDDVLAGLAAAKAAGLAPVKVNAVLMPGVNDDEAVPMLRRALDEGWRLRFIEQMPLDAGGLWNRARMITAEQILDDLSTAFDLTPVPVRGSAPAEEFFVNGGPETVGIIASVTRPFCGNCDRMRLTADGQLRNCLFASDETDLRVILRDPDLSDADIREGIRARLHSSVTAKLPGHGINDPTFIQPPRPMSAIGG
ncbi:MAG: GTP 3',8-cyclase MoaA [Actinomycetales bacterium mxb001]|nr:MAG: GTP 3',8-cyclase MoaA [Actinomycetales bacterium mxb001]